MENLVCITYRMGFGGCEKVVATICNEFSNMGINCNIITFKGSDSVYHLNEGVNHIKATNFGEKTSGFNKIKVAFKIRKIVKKLNPDRILIMPEEISPIMIPFLISLNIPIIVSDRNNPWIMPKNKINRILRKIFYRFAKGFVFQTKEASEFFSRKIQEKGTIILNPLDIKRIPKKNSDERTKEIVTAGRLEEQKNQKLLIKSFAKFNKKYDDYKLIIYGNGSLKNELTELANSLIPEKNFEFRDATNNVLNEINNSTMFVLSSNFEGLPNILIEAMACGLPCISTNCPSGGPAELIIDGENGILVPVNDEGSLVNAMIKLVEDKEYADRIGEKAREIIKRTTPEVIISQWKNYIEQDF